MKKRILFVDDDRNILEGLEAMLHGLRRDWEMEFASSGAEALQILEKESFDIVVSDMRMPGMDGVELLNEVMRRRPATVRIVLSAQSDQAMILKSVGPSHRFLSKPCEADALKSAISRACALQDLLAEESLRRQIVGMKSVPSLPSLYEEVMGEIGSENASLQKVGDIVSRDMAMSAKILQIVNSAYFGLPTRVTSVQHAVSLLGLETIKALVLSVGIFSHFDRAAVRELSLEALWEHSVVTAALAQKIAKEERGAGRIADDSYIAGLLHDIGRLILAAGRPDAYRKAIAAAQEKEMPLHEAERETLGSTHAEVGAFLLGLWGLPEPIVRAVAFHHRPTASLEQDFSPLTAVHAAEALIEERHRGGDAGEGASLDCDHLSEIKRIDRLPLWRELCEGTVGGMERP